MKSLQVGVKAAGGPPKNGIQRPQGPPGPLDSQVQALKEHRMNKADPTLQLFNSLERGNRLGTFAGSS